MLYLKTPAATTAQTPIYRMHRAQHAQFPPHLNCCFPTLHGALNTIGISVLVFFMDARSAMRPCYILPMFFLYIFYGRLSWPNG